MYLYIRASELLPASVQGDSLFLSLTARKDHEDKFYAMRPGSLATAMHSLPATGSGCFRRGRWLWTVPRRYVARVVKSGEWLAF